MNGDINSMLGIVILNYNTWDQTLKCVKSLLPTINSEDMNVYIVDNNSKVDVPMELMQYVIKFKKIRIIWNQTNGGYNAGNNVGIAQALHDGCDYILISNNDILYEYDTIDRMIDYMNLHKNVGIIGPKIIENDDKIQEIDMLITTTLAGKYKYLISKTILKKFVKKYLDSFSKSTDNLGAPFLVSSVSGACFLISRECCNLVYPLDEYPFLYEEEIILGKILENSLFKTVYDTDVTVHHDHGATTKGVTAFTFTEFVRSEVYYFKRYDKKSMVKIAPLYFLRLTQFVVRCLKHKEYRKNFKRFILRTYESIHAET
jgi:GT2 family glycosyltransferase